MNDNYSLYNQYAYKQKYKYISVSLYRVFIKYCVFPKNFVIFPNSASSAEALLFYLPGVCTHTDTKGK